ncbi:hypothetical protein C4577_03515 [Candidatus Parcubacteria bacterium]|nr:MAG: hypothetical protein C4577_03515 [Candidatus Parcubacteria bacterium]
MSLFWANLYSLVIIAQTQVDPISGGAGWVGAGLLGLVLGWLLLKHLPDKDKYIKEIIKEHGETVNKVTEKHEITVKGVAEKHEQSLKLVAEKHELAIKQAAEKHSAAVEAAAQRTELAVNKVAEKHAEIVTAMATTFTASLENVVNHCKDEMDRIASYWQQSKNN